MHVRVPGRFWVVVVTVWLVLDGVSAIFCQQAGGRADFQNGGSLISYSSEFLLSLRHLADNGPPQDSQGMDLNLNLNDDSTRTDTA